MSGRPMPLPVLSRVILLASLAAAGAACGTSGELDPDEPSVTWHRDVSPIVQARCTGCHQAEGIAPFPLETYADASAWDYSMAEQAAARTMPPWGAQETEECQPRFGWKDDLRLTDDEIAVFQAWHDEGAPEGDPASAPPPVEAPAMELDTPDLTVEPDVGFVVSPGDDRFRCFVIDPQFEQNVHVRATQVLAGDARVVHHVLVFADAGRESLALADANGQYECFGGPQVNGELLVAWAPGAVPVELPEDSSVTVDRDALLVMQVHYHALPGEDSLEDRTAVQFDLAESRTSWHVGTALIGNFDKTYWGDPYVEDGDGLLPGDADDGETMFRIPAGARSHVETQRYTFNDLGGLASLQVIGIGTHMHYVGTDMLIQLEHGQPQGTEPATEGLLQTPDWDFNWQRGYFYDVPIEQVPQIRLGDRLWMRCTYDNSLQNPFVAEALSAEGLTEPHDVYLGESTLDEMCLAAVVYAYQD